jgi:hypothetical protein
LVVGESVEVGAGAVSGDADEFGVAVEPDGALAQVVFGLADSHEALHDAQPELERVSVGRVDVARERDGLAGAYQSGGLLADVRGDVVEGAEPVVLAPAFPVRELVEVADDLVGGGRARYLPAPAVIASRPLLVEAGDDLRTV